MKLKAIGAQRANRKRGYTFGEILLVVGILAALVVGTFIFLGTRADATQYRQVADQIGEIIGTESRMMEAGVRRANMTPAQLQAALQRAVGGHAVINDATNITVARGRAAAGCEGTAAAETMSITIDASASNIVDDTPAAVEFQTVVLGTLDTLFTPAQMQRLFGVTTGGTFTAVSGTNAATTATTDRATIGICLGL